jgi:hypothetical protein
MKQLRVLRDFYHAEERLHVKDKIWTFIKEMEE